MAVELRKVISMPQPERPAEAAPAAPPRPSRLATVAREILETALLAVLVFLAVRASVQHYRVDGSSMEPTLEDGEFLLVNSLAYSRVDVAAVDADVDPAGPQPFGGRTAAVQRHHALLAGGAGRRGEQFDRAFGPALTQLRRDMDDRRHRLWRAWPPARRGAQEAARFAAAAARARPLAWTALVAVVLTGLYNLTQIGPAQRVLASHPSMTRSRTGCHRGNREAASRQTTIRV